MSKKFMIWPTHIKVILVLDGAVFLSLMIGLILYNCGIISGTIREFWIVVVVVCGIMGIITIGMFLYSLTFVSFEKEKIKYVSYTCFGIPIRSEYAINKINKVEIFYGYIKGIRFYCIGKNIFNLEIRDEVLETVLKYIPHDVISVDLQQCPQKVKGKQQQLITPLLSDKQKKELHSKGFFWCDGEDGDGEQ